MSNASSSTFRLCVQIVEFCSLADDDKRTSSKKINSRESCGKLS